MKTINIMKQLIAKHFDSKDEFVKELNYLCDIVEQEQETDREMRQIADMKYNTLPYCTDLEDHCRLWGENKQLKQSVANQIKNVAMALLVKGVINITTENAIICEFYRQNNQGQPFESEISEMSETVEVEE